MASIPDSPLPLHDQDPAEVIPEQEPEDVATIWVSRITGLVGGFFLILALAIWAGRQGHYRLVLAFLTIAMLCAILHSYTFENGG
jgi:heme A synthase